MGCNNIVLDSMSKIKFENRNKFHQILYAKRGMGNKRQWSGEKREERWLKVACYNWMVSVVLTHS